MPAPEGIFKPSQPGIPVATLVLIENSHGMIHGWSDLRDHHLPTLLGTMRLANPIVPIQVLWLITSPVNDNDPASSRTDKELPDIRFDLSPENRMSTAVINRGITLLSGTFQEQPASRHLILVAASAPGDAYSTSDRKYGPHWQELAQRLHEEQIYLHIILAPGPEMHSFTNLFYDVLNRQHRQEVPLWFNTSPGYYEFHLAGLSVGQSPCHSAFGIGDPRAVLPKAQALDSAHIPSSSHEKTYTSHPVNNSRPSELETSNSPPQSDSEVVMPSLVTRLQKMHGLTKKKIYGAKPKREPFVREDRAHDKDRHIPAPLSIPPIVPPVLPSTADAKSSSAESRMPLKAKSERARRLSAKGPLTTSPPESGGSSSGRRSPWFRRSPRNVLPADSGSGSYPSSPTSASSFSANSPVLPSPRDFETLGSGVGAGVAVAAPWEPSWPPNQTEYFLQAPRRYADSATYSVSRPASEDTLCSPPLNRTATPTPFSGTRDGLSVPGLGASAEGSKSTESAGDQPFILSPEYEAAATARFQAIFQPTKYKPETQGFTSAAPYPEPSINHRSLPLRSPTLDSHSMSFSTTMENLSYDQAQDSPPFTQSTPTQFSTRRREAHPNIKPPLGASSLEGWDGRYPM